MPALTSSPISAALEQLGSQTSPLAPDDVADLRRFLNLGLAAWERIDQLLAAATPNAVCDPDTDDVVPAELAADAREAEPREAARISTQDHLRVTATNRSVTVAMKHTAVSAPAIGTPRRAAQLQHQDTGADKQSDHDQEHDQDQRAQDQADPLPRETAAAASRSTCRAPRRLSLLRTRSPSSSGRAAPV